MSKESVLVIANNKQASIEQLADAVIEAEMILAALEGFLVENNTKAVALKRRFILGDPAEDYQVVVAGITEAKLEIEVFQQAVDEIKGLMKNRLPLQIKEQIESARAEHSDLTAVEQTLRLDFLSAAAKAVALREKVIPRDFTIINNSSGTIIREKTQSIFVDIASKRGIERQFETTDIYLKEKEVKFFDEKVAEYRVELGIDGIVSTEKRRAEIVGRITALSKELSGDVGAAIATRIEQRRKTSEKALSVDPQE